MFTNSRLFGKSPRTAAPAAPAPVPTTTAAHDLGETLELCEKREAHVLRLVAKEVESARAHASVNNRKAALECVKRKKIHEKELDRLSAQKLSLMQSEQTLHALKFNSVVMDAQARGVQAIEREVAKVKGPEGVEQVLDRLEDALDNAGDVLDASARKMGEAASYDDAELLDELEAMELNDELCDITGVAGTSGAASAAVGSPSGSSSMAARGAGPLAVPAPVPLAVPRTTAAQVARRADEEREERELAELVALQSSMKIEQPMVMPMMATAY